MCRLIFISPTANRLPVFVFDDDKFAIQQWIGEGVVGALVHTAGFLALDGGGADELADKTESRGVKRFLVVYPDQLDRYWLKTQKTIYRKINCLTYMGVAFLTETQHEDSY